MASEEEDAPVQGGAAIDPSDDLNDEFNTKVVAENANYICVFDPLDGSSNVDAGIPTGTIFGIYDHDEECPVVCDGDECTPEEARCLMNTLQPGSSLIASGY